MTSAKAWDSRQATHHLHTCNGGGMICIEQTLSPLGFHHYIRLEEKCIRTEFVQILRKTFLCVFVQLTLTTEAL